MSRNIGTRSEKRSGETRTNSPADNYPHIFTNRKVLSILADVMRKYAPVRITIFHAHTRFFGQFTHDTISPVLDDMSDTMKQKRHKETSFTGKHTESVFALSLTENVEVFKVAGQRTALISCLDHGQGAFCVPDTPYLFKCGVLHHRLLLLGSFHNLPLDRRNRLHTFYLQYQPYRSRSMD